MNHRRTVQAAQVQQLQDTQATGVTEIVEHADAAICAFTHLHRLLNNDIYSCRGLIFF